MIPREHGAWSMMIQPFLCAAILGRSWHWALIPAAIAVVAAFILREPMVVLGRQKYIWTSQHAESKAAAKWLGGSLTVLAACGALLTLRWPLPHLAILAIGSFVMTGLAVYMTIRNRQRSWWLQILSAAGLTSSCLAAALSSAGSIPQWCWWLWALSALHAFAGILVVHARLEARIAAKSRKPLSRRFRVPAALAQVPMLAAAAYCYSNQQPVLAAALLLSVAAHAWDLATLHTAKALETRLTVVGIRALTLSLAVSILIVVALW